MTIHGRTATYLRSYRIEASQHEFVQVDASFVLPIFGMEPAPRMPSSIHGAAIPITEWTDVTRATLKLCLGVMLKSLSHEDRIALLQESLVAAMEDAPVHDAISEPPF